MESIVRKPQREEQRAEVRLELPDEDTGSKFYIDPSKIPDGQSYQWQRVSTYGKDDRPEQVRSARFHWRPVPAKRHPELAGHAAGDEAVVIDGLMLCERPAYLTEEAQKREVKKARALTANHFERLQLSSTGNKDKITDKARNKAEINTSLVIPD